MNEEQQLLEECKLVREDFERVYSTCPTLDLIKMMEKYLKSVIIKKKETNT